MRIFHRPRFPKPEVPPPPDIPALAPEAHAEAQEALEGARAKREAAERQWRWVDVVSARLKRYEDEDKFAEMVEQALRGHK